MADEKKDPNKFEEYILRPGFEHNGFSEGPDGERVRHVYVGGQEGNDRVPLKPHQYLAFKDKFVSVKDHESRVAAEKEIASMQQREQVIREKLSEQGISLDDLLAGQAVTIKKPEPTPSVGTREPTPEGTVPAPTGSTATPVTPSESSPATAVTAAEANKTAAEANKIVPPKTK